MKPWNCNQSQNLSELEVEKMIDNVEAAYIQVMDALMIDWENDPNSCDTPRRVAKAMVTELFSGRYEKKPKITSFPNDGRYDQIIFTNCEEVAYCAHHWMPFTCEIFVGVLPDVANPDSRLIGLSKYTRLARWVSNRPTIQEDQTSQLHKEIQESCTGNLGVAIQVIGQHTCCSHRGVKQKNSRMITNMFSGAFKDELGVRQEFLDMIKSVRREK